MKVKKICGWPAIVGVAVDISVIVLILMAWRNYERG